MSARVSSAGAPDVDDAGGASRHRHRRGSVRRCSLADDLDGGVIAVACPHLETLNFARATEDTDGAAVTSLRAGEVASVDATLDVDLEEVAPDADEGFAGGIRHSAGGITLVHADEEPPGPTSTATSSPPEAIRSLGSVGSALGPHPVRALGVAVHPLEPDAAQHPGHPLAVEVAAGAADVDGEGVEGVLEVGDPVDG